MPTTLLNRPLSDYCSDPKRILFVYEIGDGGVIDTVYEIKPGLYDTLLSEGRVVDIKAPQKYA